MKLCGLEQIYGFRYIHAHAAYHVERPISPNVPIYKGGGVEHWSISPQLPNGLKFEQFTGVITGMCFEKVKRRKYTVTAKNWHGTATTVITIAVRPKLLTVEKGCACTGVVLGHAQQGGSCQRWGADKHAWCFVSKQCRAGRKSEALVDRWAYCNPAAQKRLLLQRKQQMATKGYIPLKGTLTPKQAHFKTKAPVELSAAEGPLGLSVSGNRNGQRTEGQCDGCMYGTRGVCHKLLSHHIDEETGLRTNEKAVICSGEKFKGVCPVYYSLCRPPRGLQYVVRKAEIRGDPSLANELRYHHGKTKVHLQYDTPMLPLYPTTMRETGGAVSMFTVHPALPNGVMFDAKSGVISGTPLKGADMHAYTITAGNGMGNCSYTLHVRVRENSPAPTASPTAPPTYPEALVDNILLKKYPFGLCKKCYGTLPVGPCKKTARQKVANPKYPNATGTFKNVRVCAETMDKTEDHGAHISACPSGYRRCYYPPLALAFTFDASIANSPAAPLTSQKQKQQQQQHFVVRVGETLKLAPQVAGAKGHSRVGGIRFAVMPGLHRGLRLDPKTGVVSGVPMQDRAQLAVLEKLRNPGFRRKELVRRTCKFCSNGTVNFCQKSVDKSQCVAGERGAGCAKTGTVLEAGSTSSCTISCPKQYELCTALKGEKEEYIIVASNSGGAVHTKIAITFNEPRTPAPTGIPTISPTLAPTHSPTKPGFMVHVKALQTKDWCRGCQHGPGGPCKRTKTYTSASSGYSVNLVECRPFMGQGDFVGSLATKQGQCPDSYTMCEGVDETYSTSVHLAPVCLCRVNLADKAYPTTGQLCRPHGAKSQKNWCYVDHRCQTKEPKKQHGMAWSHCNVDTQRELKAYIDRDTCACNGKGDYNSKTGDDTGAKCWQWDSSKTGAWCYVDEKCLNSNGRRNGKYWKTCTIPPQNACDCNGLMNKQKWGSGCQKWGFDPMEWCFVSDQCPLASPSQDPGLHWAHCGNTMKKMKQGAG
jgi:hypothetical protein